MAIPKNLPKSKWLAYRRLLARGYSAPVASKFAARGQRNLP